MFSNGTEAMIWMENNCYQCKRFDPESAEDTECEFANKLDLGFLGEEPTEEEGKPYNCTGDPSTECSQRIEQ